jgi:hypothetical protein
MRRKLEDWERAEELSTPDNRKQVDQFSPRSQAILEIQSARDLEILEKVFANSVLLGEDGYHELLADIEAEKKGTKPASAMPSPATSAKTANRMKHETRQQELFEAVNWMALNLRCESQRLALARPLRCNPSARAVRRHSEPESFSVHF